MANSHISGLRKLVGKQKKIVSYFNKSNVVVPAQTQEKRAEQQGLEHSPNTHLNDGKDSPRAASSTKRLKHDCSTSIDSLFRGTKKVAAPQCYHNLPCVRRQGRALMDF